MIAIVSVAHWDDDVTPIDVDDSQIHAVMLGQFATSNHVARDAVEDDDTLVEQHQAIGELAGEREVVQCRDHSKTAFGDFGLQQLQYLHLVAKVETRGGLIEHDDHRGLGEGTSKHHSLAFTAGQRDDVSLREIRE